jgi:hypothetical protein
VHGARHGARQRDEQQEEARGTPSVVPTNRVSSGMSSMDFVVYVLLLAIVAAVLKKVLMPAE